MSTQICRGLGFRPSTSPPQLREHLRIERVISWKHKQLTGCKRIQCMIIILCLRVQTWQDASYLNPNFSGSRDKGSFELTHLISQPARAFKGLKGWIRGNISILVAIKREQTNRKFHIAAYLKSATRLQCIGIMNHLEHERSPSTHLHLPHIEPKSKESL